MVKIFDVYDNLINESNGNIGFLKYEELKKWHEEEIAKNEQITDYKTYTIRAKQTAKKFNQASNELYREYGESIYGFSGDINVKYIYHFTNFHVVRNIVYENALTGDLLDGISFTSYANLYKHKFVFSHPNEYSEGRTYKNVPCRLKFDFNKMKNNGLNFVLGNEDMGTYYGEFEIRLPKLELNNIDKYLLEVAIFKNKAKYINETNLNELKEYLSNKGIKLILF
jgi:hypothetical protein